MPRNAASHVIAPCSRPGLDFEAERFAGRLDGAMTFS